MLTCGSQGLWTYSVICVCWQLAYHSSWQGGGSRRHDNTCKQKIVMQDALVSTLTEPLIQRIFFPSLFSARQLSRELLYIRRLMSPHFLFDSKWIIREIPNCWPTIPAGLARTQSISRKNTKLCSRNTGNTSFEYFPQLQRMWIFHAHSVFQCPLNDA